MPRKEPNFRFAGFAGEWETRKLGEIGEIVMGQSPNSNNYTEDTEDMVLIQGNADLKNGKVVPRIFTKEITKKAYPGDIIFTVRAPVGEVAISDIEAVIGRGVSSIKGNKFIYYDLIYKQNKFYWDRLSSGSTFASVNSKDLKSALIKLPSTQEQEKIGELFEVLDGLIEKQEAYIQILEEMKKGFLQGLFPKKGQTRPDLRFAGFEGDWEEKRLKDIITSEIKGKAKASEINPGNVEYLDAERLNGGDIILTDFDQNVNSEDVLILWDGSKAGAVYSGFAGALGSTLKAFKLEENIDSRFVYSYLKMHERKINVKYTTPNIPHVVKDFTKIFHILLPSLAEQKKIGEFFEGLDTRIDLENRKLDELNDAKKALLQNCLV